MGKMLDCLTERGKDQFCPALTSFSKMYIYNWRVKKIEGRKKEIDAEVVGRVCESLLARRTQWHVRYLSNTNHKVVIFQFTNAELLIVCVWWFWILCLEKRNLTFPFLSFSGAFGEGSGNLRWEEEEKNREGFYLIFIFI